MAAWEANNTGNSFHPILSRALALTLSLTLPLTLSVLLLLLSLSLTLGLTLSLFSLFLSLLHYLLLSLLLSLPDFLIKAGLAKMLKGGVIMDVINVEQAKIAEAAGAVAGKLALILLALYSFIR